MMGAHLSEVGWVLLSVALIGAAYVVFAAVAVALRLSRNSPQPARFPPVSLLKPLHGREPGLEADLDSFLTQDYPGHVQIVFGLHSADDPAVSVVRELRRRHPTADIEVVIDGRPHGANRKVANLINMAPRARHDLLVISDSDIRVPPDYLRRLAGVMQDPGVGVATCFYVGSASRRGLPARLSAAGINLHFLPNAAFGVQTGLAQPCFGSTIALRRRVLRQIGGFERLANRLADDYEIGEAARALGYRIAMPALTVAHGCAEASWRELLSHELRWSRTIRLVNPGGFAGSFLTNPLPFALAGAALTRGSTLGLGCLAIVLACRLASTVVVARSAKLPRADYWLIPVRDLLSFGIFVATFFGSGVSWRGRRFEVERDGVMLALEKSGHATDTLPAGPIVRRLRRRSRLTLSGQA